MKKIFYFLFAMTLFFTVSAQEHLKFKGVPIDGTLKNYTNAMINAGFQYEGTQDGVAVLSGDFAGYKGCIVGVSTLQNCDVVSWIAVIFPEKDTWISVLGDYEHLKDMLTEKYGNPQKSKEEFTGYIGDYDNGMVMHALSKDEYVWFTSFSTELGEIELSIISSDYSKASVRLRYYDKINSEKVREAAMDDL